MGKNNYKIGYTFLGIMIGIVLSGLVHIIFSEWFLVTDARITYLKSGVEPQIVYPTEEQDLQQSETLLQPQESQESQKSKESQPTSEEVEVVYTTETDDLSYTLDGNVLELTFKKFNKSWPSYEDGTPYFFTSNIEVEKFRTDMTVQGYTSKSIEDVTNGRIITKVLSEEAPEVSRFEINGNVLTIYFKTTPKEMFEFRSGNCSFNKYTDEEKEEKPTLKNVLWNGRVLTELHWEGVTVLPEN